MGNRIEKLMIKRDKISKEIKELTEEKEKLDKIIIRYLAMRGHFNLLKIKSTHYLTKKYRANMNIFTRKKKK